MPRCPPAEELAQYALRALAPERARNVTHHIDACPDCRRASASLVSELPSVTRRPDAGQDGGVAQRVTGSRLGRYVLLHEVGAGSMGVVYAAYDPELDRKIAVKLLKRRSAEARRRLLREGRALARLSHPNVAAVFDVGSRGAEVFIALEYVPGETLRQWSTGASRTWRQVRDVFVAVGRGLSAAHAAGLVHRDFKPDNVLIADDGRPRVVDFGLVDAEGTDAASVRLSGVSGTPAYMAPEQLLGSTGDASSDQFSFCVSLHECLLGARPFEGSSVAALIENVTRGRRAPTPGHRAVPRRVRRVIDRGLSLDPADRFPSMDALLSALAPIMSSRRRAAMSAVGGAALLAAAVVAIGPVRQEAATCRAVSDELADVWNPRRRARLHSAFLASGRPHAMTSLARVTTELDGYARDWAAERVAVCTDSRVLRRQSDSLHDLRAACLERRRDSLDEAIERLAGSGPAAVDEAIRVVTELPIVAECKDTERLRRTVPLPDDPGERRRIGRLQARLASVDVLRTAGRYDDALRDVDAVLSEAGELDYPPVTAEAHYLRGVLLDRLGDFARAKTSLRSAVEAAARGRDDLVEARAWIALLYVEGVGFEAADEALSWVRPAAAAATARAGDERVAARLQNALGLVHSARGEYREARGAYRAAVDALERVTGSATPEMAGTLANLSAVTARLGDESAARSLAERAVELDRARFGDRHPAYAQSLMSLANRLAELGELEDALVHQRTALAILRDTFGEDSEPVLAPHYNLAVSLAQLGELARARRHAERALRIAERHYGASHQKTAMALATLANIMTELERYEDATRLYERALRAYDDAAADHHPLYVSLRANLGRAKMGQGRYSDAQREYERALAGLRDRPGDPMLPAIWTGLGEALLQQGDAAAAAAWFERSLAARSGAGGDPLDRADSEFSLARALWRAGGKRRRALALARRARVAFRDGGRAAAPFVAAYNEWARRRDVPLAPIEVAP